MNLRSLFIALIYILLSSCHWGTNTTTPQNTYSIEESKDIEHFICEYKCIQLPEGMFSFKEIWAEHGWYNDTKDNRVVRTKSDFVNICFTLNDQKSLYMPDGYVSEWAVQDTNTSSYIGYHGYGMKTMYIMSYKGKIPSDSIQLIVYKKNRDSSRIQRIPIGTLTLIKIK